MNIFSSFNSQIRTSRAKPEFWKLHSAGLYYATSDTNPNYTILKFISTRTYTINATSGTATLNVVAAGGGGLEV